MIDNTLTQKVLILTFNQDSFPLATGIPPEEVKLTDPKNISKIKEIVDKQNPKLVIIDGCIEVESIVRSVVAVSAVRNRKRLDLNIYIVNQDKLLIRGARWIQNPEDVKQYA